MPAALPERNNRCFLLQSRASDRSKGKSEALANNQSMAASGEPDWSAIPYPLLLSIAERLPFADRFRLRRVCTSWGSAMADHLTALPLHSPFLLLHSDPGDLSFLSLSTKQSYLCSPLPATLECVGCRDGWLLTLNRSHHVRLLNPFTGSDGILLPSPSAAALFGSFRRMKVALSSASPDAAVAFIMLRQGCNSLAFARPGDGVWSPLHAAIGVRDFAYHARKFVAVLRGGGVQAFDLDGPSPRPLPELDRSDYDAEILHYSLSEHYDMYLVSSSGQLLQVWREMDEESRLTKRFLVTKFKDGGWVEIGGLGDRALLLDSKQAMSVSAGGVPGLKVNSIYFAAPNGSACEVGVFDMEKGTIQPCFPPNLLLDCQGLRPPIWFSVLS